MNELFGSIERIDSLLIIFLLRYYGGDKYEIW